MRRIIHHFDDPQEVIENGKKVITSKCTKREVIEVEVIDLVSDSEDEEWYFHKEPSKESSDEVSVISDSSEEDSDDTDNDSKDSSSDYVVDSEEDSEGEEPKKKRVRRAPAPIPRSAEPAPIPAPLPAPDFWAAAFGAGWEQLFDDILGDEDITDNQTVLVEPVIEEPLAHCWACDRHSLNLQAHSQTLLCPDCFSLLFE